MKYINGENMFSKRSWGYTVAVLLSACGSFVATPAYANECTASGATLRLAAQQYARQCSPTRKDCDQVEGLWYCSNERIDADRIVLPGLVQQHAPVFTVETNLPEEQQGRSECVDPDGDGWGWNGTASCRITFQSNIQSDNSNRKKLWFMEQRLLHPGKIKSTGSTSSPAGDFYLSKHDTINNAYIGPNAWAFGSRSTGAGPDSNLRDAYVKWSSSHDKALLNLDWFVGGYNRDYNGLPQISWYNGSGGNNVKAYPRMGIGSASGQPHVTTGTPNGVPVTTTDGITTINQYEIQNRVGIPARISQIPEINIHADFSFAGGSSLVNSKDKYGNFYFAIDSYYHDVDTIGNITNSSSSLVGSLNAINDSSGTIFNNTMNRQTGTTKRWATMIWYHKPTYIGSIGGYPLNNNQTVLVDGRHYFLRYKVERVGGKPFKYIAFIENRDVENLFQGGRQPVVHYKRFAEFMVTRLQEHLNAAGNLPDSDGVFRIIKAPSKNLVLSDVNVGVEISANPDTIYNMNPAPVGLRFKQLYFDVSTKGVFGFTGKNAVSDQPINQPQ